MASRGRASHVFVKLIFTIRAANWDSAVITVCTIATMASGFLVFGRGLVSLGFLVVWVGVAIAYGGRGRVLVVLRLRAGEECGVSTRGIGSEGAVGSMLGTLTLLWE